jgi:hypothetical protein
MSDGQRQISDTPTGPEPREHDVDAPDQPLSDAGKPAEGNLVEHGQVRTDHPSTGEPQKGRASQKEAGETAAESVVESLQADWRITKGSDPDSPVAGLLAAAAATNGQLDKGTYRRFVAETDLDWASVEDLEARYGSFQSALVEAGIAAAAP